MKTERFSPQAKIETAETEIKSPEEAVEAEVSNEQVEQFAASAEKNIAEQTANVLPEAQQRIESSSQSMNVSPDMLSAVRQEQGLDGKLNEYKQKLRNLQAKKWGKLEK